MQTQAITIQGRTFNAPSPYTEGHVLTGAEAGALNQVLAENLRNNFAAQMKKAKEDGKDLSQTDFDTYAANYHFGVRGGGGLRKVVDPIEREARALIKPVILAALAKKGIKQKELGDGELENLITAGLAKYPQVMENAKRVVEARQAAAASMPSALAA